VRATRAPEELSVDDLRPLIVEEGCGLRPARRGGTRLAVDWIPAGPSSDDKVPVVFNYGCVFALVLAMVLGAELTTRRHGGYGFQSSWGSASVALRLLESALAKGEAAKDTLNTAAASRSAGDSAKNEVACLW
jgi:D-amino-acid oxidase